MKALVTTPAKYVHYSLAADSTMMFGLAHLALKPDWMSDLYCRQLRLVSIYLGAHLIIDNGVTELGEPMSFGDLRHVASKVGAREIVLPDVYKDAETTREYVQDSLRRIEHYGAVPFDCMAVVHEQVADDLARTLEEWAKHDPIKVLGIPKHLTRSKRWPCGRVSVLKVIENLGFHKRFQVHLLGVWADMLEVQTIARGFPWVRSVDTSWPVMAGLKGIDIAMFPTHKVPYEPDPKSSGHDLQVLRNIQTYQRWASGE